MNVIAISEKGASSIVDPDRRQRLEKDGVYHDFLEKQGFVFGSVQMSLFDENFLLRQGHRELRLWPFVQYDPRMVC